MIEEFFNKLLGKRPSKVLAECMKESMKNFSLIKEDNMKKMTIIDLLNKIAKEKKYPKIKFNNSIYEYHDKEHGYCRYYHDNTYICLNTDYYLFDILNDEVEILEKEKKIPEKIKIEEKSISVKGTTFFREKDIEIFQKLSLEINEILDYLETKGE